MSERTLTECRMLAEQLARMAQEQERLAYDSELAGFEMARRRYAAKAEGLRFAADELTAVLNPQTLRAVR